MRSLALSLPHSHLLSLSLTHIHTHTLAHAICHTMTKWMRKRVSEHLGLTMKKGVQKSNHHFETLVVLPLLPLSQPRLRGNPIKEI